MVNVLLLTTDLQAHRDPRSYSYSCGVSRMLGKSSVAPPPPLQVAASRLNVYQGVCDEEPPSATNFLNPPPHQAQPTLSPPTPPSPKGNHRAAEHTHTHTHTCFSATLQEA
jgi:hypothetical protein